ncbi:transcriptional regulator with XRE-family HTH domain [Actinomadura luteofluorescens]|uniref:Transcriptional regulator with XRE-family HTH domain n=1 Tax=Actinomadura luteofluorescens TaxID=46163 RepID=A0A7Y9EM66_9ACTN|nr:helix-turn-helix transcriptional regulator [Actinomadura luteofluorescens]NYD50161.1 transcriptional regulator with XRE-family HTH domain [Actinomadura luteofluorescens]
MPIVREPLDPKISMWYFLAFYLRFWREKMGLSLTQCGEIMGVTRGTVSNFEAGRRRLQDDHARALDRHFGTGLLFQLLLWFARMAHDPNWGKQLVKYEQEAALIKTYHGQVIPLALQTDEYTWAYVQTSTRKDFEAAMERRVARKRSFFGRGDDVEMWATLDESVLAREVGGPRVMKAQLEHLLATSDLPQFSIRIVPFKSGAHIGVDGSLQVLSLESRDIAYSGAQNGGRLIEAPGEVRELSVMFDRIGAKALSEEGSREIIKRYLESYE